MTDGPTEYVPRTRKKDAAKPAAPEHPAPQKVATATKRMEDRCTVGDAVQISQRAAHHYASIAAGQAAKAQWLAIAAFVMGVLAFIVAVRR